MAKYKAVITQPDGAVRTKFFDTEFAAQAWIDTRDRYVPPGCVTSVQKVK